MRDAKATGPVRTASTVRTVQQERYTPELRSAAEIMEGELHEGMPLRNAGGAAGPAESQVWWREIEREEDGNAGG